MVKAKGILGRIEKAPRGSALLAALMISFILAVITASLVSFSLDKRRETARLQIYNEELYAAEQVLARFVSQIYFVSVNRVPQTWHASSGGLAGFVTTEGASVNDSNFNVGMGVDAIRQGLNTVIDQTIVDEIPEVEPWINYNIILDSYRIVAGAVAYTDSGLPLAGQLQRPGVYVGRTVSFYQVPLLNYAIFYQNTLELDGGARIDIHGKLHTNGDWYLTSSSSVYYHDYCSVAGNFFGGIYNPLDGSRRGWWSGSDNINMAVQSPATPGADAPSMDTIRDSSSISINNHYLSSADYGASTNGGNPIYFTHNPDGTEASPEDWWTANNSWVDTAASMFNGHLRDSAHGVEEVQLPIGEASNPRVLIEEPRNYSGGDGLGDADNPSVRDAKMVYDASIIIEPTSTSWTSANGADIANYVRAYRLVPDASQTTGFREEEFSLLYKLPTDSPTDPARTFISHERIYNGREEEFVNLIDIDMDKLAEYLDTTNPNADASLSKFSIQNTSDPDNSAILYVNANQSMVPSGEQLAPRIKNADDLAPVLSAGGLHPSHGMSIITNGPLYTKGNVNSQSSTDRVPLLLACDAINILSNSFNDSNYRNWSSGGNGPNNGASNTTTNAVFLTGNVPTKPNQYGGGAENFFRYLENWGGDTHYFRGSMLNLFESEVATASWDKNTGTGTSSGYYSPPRRDWGWDTNYASGTAPPGMPRTFEYSSGQWELVSKATYEALTGATQLTLTSKP